MKLIIDIPDGYNLDDIKNGSIACGQILKAVRNGTPYEGRPTGHWKKIGEEYYNWSNHEIIKCSICSYKKDVPTLNMSPNFCEKCGADMRGSKE